MAYTRRQYPVLLLLKANTAWGATIEAAEIATRFPASTDSFHIQETEGKYYFRCAVQNPPTEENLTLFLGDSYKDAVRGQKKGY